MFAPWNWLPNYNDNILLYEKTIKLGIWFVKYQ